MKYNKKNIFASYIFILVTIVNFVFLSSIELNKNIIAIKNISNLLVLILLVSYFIKKSDVRMLILKNNYMVNILFFYCLCSYFWSISKGTTAWQTIGVIYIISISLFILIHYEYDYIKIIDYIYKYLSILSIINFFAIILFPNISLMVDNRYESVYKGIFEHRNTLGLFMAMCILFSIYKIILNNKSIYSYFILVVSIVNIVASKSVTCIILTLLCGLYYIVSVKRKLKRTNIIILCGSIFLNSVLLLSNSISSNKILTVIGRDATFSGRTSIWQITIELIKQSKWLGYGYRSIWANQVFEQYYYGNLLGFGPSSSHNGVLDLFLELGILGAVVYLFFLINLIRRYNAQKNDGNIKSLNILFVMIIFIFNYNLMESSLLTPTFVLLLQIIIYNLLGIINKKDFK